MLSHPRDFESHRQAIAISVLMDQSQAEASAKSFSFEDYMRTQDNGTVPFPLFLEKCVIPEDSKWTPTAEERQRCEEAWKRGLRGAGAKHKEKEIRRGSSARKLVSGVSATSVTVAVEGD